ncbi:MAG: BamA/TamA family outer membrane protein [Alcaligenaceae bacterium]|nr:BamA/TamA family outer membrane protein [Alcaligenaceae bacterium]
MRWKRFVLSLVCGAGFAVLSGSPALAERPDVVIDPGGVAPAALKSIVAAVESITRLAEDQDAGEVSRLRRRAYDATLSALQTQGYFEPTVTLEVTEDIGGEAWDIIIEPGERTKVGQVDITFQGQITDAAFAPRTEALRAGWSLKPDDLFINAHWSDAKTDLLDNVNRKDFYFARYALTQAVVHPDQARADLTLQVDSGPRVTLGPMVTEGLVRVPSSLIERYVRYAPGDPYDQDLLDDWQQALQSTTFFRGAFVTLDSAPAVRQNQPDGSVALPVHVRVSEAAARRAVGSLGADSDNGIRLEGLYRQNVVMGLPVALETGASIDSNIQRAFFDIHLPPTLSGYKDSFGLLAEHSDIEGLDNRRYGAGWTRRQERKGAGDSRVEYETLWTLVVAHDRTRISGAPGFKVPTAIGTWQWLRRDVNDKYDPREGYLLDFGLGAGVTLDTGQPFYRSSLRAQHWWSIGSRDVLTVRGEVGKMWSKTDRVPTTFGYRTGGSRSIRGYKYQSIGINTGDAVVGAPTLAVASIEYTHYVTEQIGVNFFIDAGDAAETFRGMDIALGYGMGVGMRTPAGPFFIDLAYGQRDKRLRLHFSLGIAF